MHPHILEMQAQAIQSDRLEAVARSRLIRRARMGATPRDGSRARLRLVRTAPPHPPAESPPGTPVVDPPLERRAG